MLLEHGADLGNRDADGKTPLHVFFNPVVSAVLIAHRLAIEEVLSTCDTSGMNILQYAAWSSQSESRHLDPYLQGAEAHTCIGRDHAGRSLLHFAAQRGNVRLLQYLLALPACPSVDTRDASGRPVLHYATQSKRAADAIDALLAHGADMHALDLDGQTALHCAAARNNLPAIRRLLELCDGRVVRLRDKNGMTPVDLACRHKSLEAAALLGLSCSAEQPPKCPGCSPSAQPTIRRGNMSRPSAFWECYRLFMSYWHILLAFWILYRIPTIVL